VIAERHPGDDPVGHARGGLLGEDLFPPAAGDHADAARTERRRIALAFDPHRTDARPAAPADVVGVDGPDALAWRRDMALDIDLPGGIHGAEA
jgi:hypothetical protein